jgi:hypothetical protein
MIGSGIFAEESLMSPKRRKRRLGRRPVLTEEQKRMVRKIAQEEIETAFRRMLGGVGVHRARRKP